MKGLASVASLTPLSCSCCSHSKPKTQRFLQVRSQSFKDEGSSSSSNMVDANLDVLRARMEQVMKNEKLECATSKRMKYIGWNQTSNSIKPSNYESQDMHGHAAMMTGIVEVIGLVSGSISLVFLCGSLMIFFVSVLVHS